MTYETRSSTIYNAVSILQTSSQIIGAENSDFGSTGQPFRTHHADVSVSDR